MSACIEWAGYVNSLGYGVVGRNTLAHRDVYERCVGPIPEGHHIHHRCENKRCVNVDHLELVAAGDHIRLHRATPACPRCGGTRRAQMYRDGKPNGRRCLDCHARAERDRLHAAGRALGTPNGLKTHCRHGHEYTDENTRRDRHGRRYCRACQRASDAARRAA